MLHGCALINKDLCKIQSRLAAQIPAYATVVFDTTFCGDFSVGMHFETPPLHADNDISAVESSYPKAWIVHVL